MGDCYAPSNLMSKVYDAVEDPVILGGSDEGETIFDSEASISNDFTLVSDCTFVQLASIIV